MSIKNSKKKKKVLFFLDNLSGGGAERVISELANNYNNENFEYKILLTHKELDYRINSEILYSNSNDAFFRVLFKTFSFNFLFQSLCQTIPIEKLRRFFIRIYYYIFFRKKNPTEPDCFRLFRKNWQTIFKLNRAIFVYQPDIVAGVLLEGSNALIYLSKKTFLDKIEVPFRWVALEQNNTLFRLQSYYSGENFTYWLNMTKSTLQLVDKIITPSEGVKTGLLKHFSLESDKIIVIGNPVNIKQIRNTDKVKSNEKYIMAAGRLHKQKRFDLLINAYSKIASKIDENLYIIGRGKLENELKELVEKLKLGKRVRFIGFTQDVWRHMKSATCLVLTSEYEGFGNVIVESMACQCPVISFDCDFGPSEIIRDGKNGILVEFGNLHKLSEEILNLVSSNDLREKLISEASKTCLQYDTTRVCTKYEKCFLDILELKASK